MVIYHIEYTIKGHDEIHEARVEATGINNAKIKIGKKHGYKSGRMIKVKSYFITGYF